MSNENPLSGNFVKFKGNFGHASVQFIPMYLNNPALFDGYREEARLAIKVLMGEATQEEALRLPEFGYNAMGINNFLAALAYEILEQESHINKGQKP